MSKQIDRRKFLLQSAKAGLGLTLGSIAINSYADEILPALDFILSNQNLLKRSG